MPMSQSCIPRAFRNLFRRRTKKTCMLLLVLLILFSGVQCSPTREMLLPQKPLALVSTKGFAHSQSELPPDPGMTFGSLENGFRYILKENQTPSNRVSMHLFIQAGSLNERNEQQGMAHLLEHMLFNGSENFGPGEMIKFFQRIGMQFGPDANAHTGFTQTVYDVILPKGDAKSIKEGFVVLRDYAQGALLESEELEKEKKVLLSEMRSRDSADFRLLKATFEFEMPNALPTKRFPIGQEEVIRKMDARMLREFYDAWYRPERMFLVMVGDFDPQVAQTLIDEMFGPMQPRGAPSELPDFGDIEHQGIKPFYFFEEKVGTTRIRIETIEEKAQPADSRDWRRQSMIADLADHILGKRLEALVKRSETGLISAGAGSGYYLQQVKYAQIGAETRPENWSNALSTLEQELRRALTFGFLPSELARAKKDYLAMLREEVQASKTRDSNRLAREIISDLNNWRVIQNPEQQLEMADPLMDEISVEHVNREFKRAWANPHRLILVTGNANLGNADVTPETRIAEIYRESLKIAVVRPVEKSVAEFPYLPEPDQKAEVTSRRQHTEGIEQITFNNNLELFLKPTAFTKNQVMVALSFGKGKSSEPQDQPGLARLTERVINESGFGRMDPLELEEALAGHLASIQLEVDEELFVVKGRAPTAELPLLMQLLRTFVEDPGYRNEALQLALKRYEQDYKTMACDVDGVMRIKGQRFLAGGDTRFGLPSYERVSRYSLDEIRNWFGPQLQSSPLELAVVGDFDPQTAVDATALNLGGIASRQKEEFKSKRPGPVFPVGGKLSVAVGGDIAKSLVVTAYPTEDFWDIHLTRRLNVLADVLNERLRITIREKLGAAYSPFAYNHPYKPYPGYGLMQAFLNVDPQMSARMVEEVKAIAAGIAAEGIEEDEFRRVLDPTLTSLRDLRQKNAYWLDNVLVGAGRHPEKLAWTANMMQDYAAISSKEITDLARKYLVREKAASVIITSGQRPGDSGGQTPCLVE